MTRPRRPLLKWICTALALVLLAGWGLSRWRWLFWIWGSGSEFSGLSVNSGAVCYSHNHHPQVPFGGNSPFPGSVRLAEPFAPSSLIPGFELTWRSPRPRGGDMTAITLPLWAPLLITAAAAGMLWRTDSRRRRGANHCPACDYDLTGISGPVCPECGGQKPSSTPQS